MAYVINNDDDQNAQNVATNIFQNTTGAQNQGGQGQQQGGQSQAPAGGDQSTSIAQGSQTQSKAPAVSNSASSSKEVLRRNEGKIQSPVDVGGLRQNMATAKQNLQNEADSYVSGQAQKVAQNSVDQAGIQGALKGDDTAWQKTQQRLTQAQPQYENFAQKTNTVFQSKVNELGDSQLRNYFKQAGGPQATQGDAAFDAMLLGKNKQFKQDRAQAMLDSQILANQTKDIRDKTDTNAKAAYGSAYQADTDRIRNAIQSQIDPVRAEAEAKATAENAKRQALASRSTKDAVGDQGYKDWLTGIANEVGGNGDEDASLRAQIEGRLSGGYGDQGYTDANFINYNQAPLSAGNFLDQSQAGMLNRGQALLGTGGQSYASLGAAPEAYKYNADAAKAFLSGRLGDIRAANEKRAQEERDRAENERRLAEERANAPVPQAVNPSDKYGTGGANYGGGSGIEVLRDVLADTVPNSEQYDPTSRW